MKNKEKKSLISRFLSLNGSGVLVAMIVFIAAVSIAAPYITGGAFLTQSNITNVFRQQTHIGIIACAMTYVIITGNIDLSVGSLLTLLVVLCAKFTNIGPWAAIFMTLGLGILAGAINGALVSGLKLNAFITTLGTGSIFGALTMIIASGHTVRITEPVFDFIGSGYLFGFLPVAVLVLLIVVVISAIVLKRTVFGQRLYAIGSNPTAARFSGIRSRLDVFLTYVLTGFCCGLAAVIYIARSVSANPQIASGKEMDIILAVVLGGTSILGGRGSIWGSVIGFLFIGFMSAGFTFLGLNQYTQWIIMGVILVIALAIDVANEKGVKLWKRKASGS